MPLQTEHVQHPQPSISGVGLITPLGADARATFEALRRGDGIAETGRAACEPDRALPRVSALALTAAREAIAQAGWDKRTLADAQTGVVIGTSKGPIDEWIAALSHMADSPYVLAGGLARIMEDLAAGLELGPGPRLTVSAACASGLHALVRAVLLMASGQCRRVLVVAAESSLHELFIASFRRLGVLARPGEVCRPFDHDRSGFVISEAAAAVCVESESSDRTLAKVFGFALGTDAQHLTAGDPSGLAMRRLLQRAMNGQAVDLVHAHGTGTQRNDPIELAAVDAVIDQAMPTGQVSLYSHKGALGHSLGASGMVSVVLSCLMHKEGIVLPNTRTPQPLAARRVSIDQTTVRRPIRHSLVTAAGFGGAAAVVGLASP